MSEKKKYVGNGDHTVQSAGDSLEKRDSLIFSTMSIWVAGKRDTRYAQAV